jgi:hypothetical protein
LLYTTALAITVAPTNQTTTKIITIITLTILLTTPHITNTLAQTTNNQQTQTDITSYGTITYTQTPTTTPTPTPTATLTPTPTPTPATNQIASEINAIWLHSSDITSINYGTLKAAQITDIYMLTADWTDSYTLNKLVSDQEIATMLTNAHNHNIRVHAWTIRFWSSGQAALDISSSSARSACINAVTTLVTKSYSGHTFDGHNDDLSEHFAGTWQNYADYLSALTTALQSNGKISSVDMLVWTGYPVESRFPTLNCDYICGMFYSDETWSQSDFYATIPRALQYSPTQLVIGMYYDTRIGPYSAGSQLQYVGNVISSISDKSKLAGFSLYCGDSGGWNYIDWTAWNNWV